MFLFFDEMNQSEHPLFLFNSILYCINPPLVKELFNKKSKYCATSSTCHLFKVVIRSLLHCLLCFPLFSTEQILQEFHASQSSPLNMWRMKVKTGLLSNPSRLFVSSGHWENSDVVLPCKWGRRGMWGGRDVRGGRELCIDGETKEKETFLCFVQ